MRLLAFYLHAKLLWEDLVSPYFVGGSLLHSSLRVSLTLRQLLVDDVELTTWLMKYEPSTASHLLVLGAAFLMEEVLIVSKCNHLC